MPAFLLCVSLVCVTTLAWAQVDGQQTKESPPKTGQNISAAALRAVPPDSNGWVAMDALEAAAASPDRALAALAALRASQVVHAVDAFDLEEQEIARATLRSYRTAWLAIASNENRWVDIRVYALDVATRLQALLATFGETAPAPLWQPFLSSSDPEMRVAAITLVPESVDLSKALREFLIGEQPEEVALSAAQRLCGPLREELSDTPKLDAPALERLQALARATSLPIIARTQLAPCLLVDGSVQSRRTLAILLQKSPPALRRHLSNLIKRQASAKKE
tara:strand:- start:18355 stop:19191 length:837 start_codon:yes stop_codon:yes gene_type:complete